ncbi:MAG: threonine-phosphate decarboxylase CobD [Pseudomonadota bacterium]
MRDHGGNLDWAVATYGGPAKGWIDLSTGINARPYPVPEMPPRAWTALPTQSDMSALVDAARRAYDTAGEIVPLAGAQAAIQLVPRLLAPGTARVLGPTYNEHAAALRTSGWSVVEVARLDDLAGADLAIVVNPNNPDGRTHRPEALIALAQYVGVLVVDESFADSTPELSLAPQITPETERIVVERSFGKFYGLAGVRLGFALVGTGLAERLTALTGPWGVSGPAIAAGQAALADPIWHARTCKRLARETARVDALATAAGWSLVGGTALFRTYATPNAQAAQDHLASRRIWTRRFLYSDTWLRLGLPGRTAHWARLEAALTRPAE